MKTITIQRTKSEEKVSDEVLNMIINNTTPVRNIHSASQLEKRLTPEAAQEILEFLEHGEEVTLNY